MYATLIIIFLIMTFFAENTIIYLICIFVKAVYKWSYIFDGLFSIVVFFQGASTSRG